MTTITIIGVLALSVLTGNPLFFGIGVLCAIWLFWKGGREA